MSIEVKNLSKSFGAVQALKDVSLSFGENKIYGLLGRNGAGKSTLLNVIANRIFPDAGTVTLDGRPAAENDGAQSSLYLMSEQTLYPEDMKIKDAFRWTKNFYPGFDRDFAEKLAGSFDLNLNAKVKTLSTGYSSIFKLVVALSVNTPYVFFDEPVLGLDANHRELFYKTLLARYGEHPFTAVISTHLIEEAAGLIEDVAILKEGKLLRACSREELLQNVYTVSGPVSQVNEYLRDRKTLGTDSLGGLLSAYVEGRPEKEKAPAGLEFSGMDLQKLFILMTNE